MEREELSVRLRVCLWAAAWGLATPATVAPSFDLLPCCWLFPIGLVAPFGASDWTSPVATYGAIVGGWCLYLALSIYGLRQRRSPRYLLAYAILVALLALNAAGCRYEVSHMKIGC
jgi:hypothetical protein